MQRLLLPVRSRLATGERVWMKPLCVADIARRFVAALLAGTVVLAGCAPGVSNRSLGESNTAPAQVVVVEAAPEPEPSPEQVRAAEIRDQKRDIAQLREQLEADRARADAASSRADAAALETQESVRLLQAELAEVRVRADAASAQADQAFAIATEFLSNLVDAREEQRSIVERNLKTFDALNLRLSAIEGLVVASDRQQQAELAQTNSRTSELELRSQQTDQDLDQMRTQLADLYREGEEVRAAIDSGPMLRMLRDLETTQRDTAVLRGLMEEMQREQQEGRKRLQDYYVDLDTRIQALQERERAVRENNPDDAADESDFAPESSIDPDALDGGIDDELSGEIMESGELGDEAARLLESFEDELRRQDLKVQAALVDAVPVEAVSDDQASPKTPTAGENAGTEHSSLPSGSDPLGTVPGIVNTIDSVPVVSDALVANVGGETRDGENAAIVEPPLLTAHGLIVTDWSDRSQPPMTRDSGEQSNLLDAE